MKNLKIALKVPVMIVLGAIISSIAVGVIAVTIAEDSLRQSTEDKLQALLGSRKATMDQLRAIWIAYSIVECEMRGLVMSLMLALHFDNDELCEAFAQNISDLKAAWSQVTKELGIEEDLRGEFGPLSTDIFLPWFEEILPEPDQGVVEKWLEVLGKHLN